MWIPASRPEGFSLDVTVSGPQVNPSYEVNFFSQALDRIRRVPGVESADAVMCPPMGGIGGGSCWTSPYAPEDRPAPPENQRPWTLINMVTPGDSRTMKTPLLQGRPFTVFDAAHAAPVVIVNQVLRCACGPAGTRWGNVFERYSVRRKL